MVRSGACQEPCVRQAMICCVAVSTSFQIRTLKGPRGPFNVRIWKEVDTATQQIIAWRTHGSWQAPERTIYMDGRPHPPEYAAHTWQGFSTGKWEGDILTITTTHLKTGWIRRNGIPRSDRATLIEHWIRHGDYLTLVSIVNDPAYL